MKQLTPDKCSRQCRPYVDYIDATASFENKYRRLHDEAVICAEKAYRRGVGQTLAMLSYLPDGAVSKQKLAKLAYDALMMRTDGEEHDALLHELFEQHGLIESMNVTIQRGGK